MGAGSSQGAQQNDIPDWDYDWNDKRAIHIAAGYDDFRAVQHLVNSGVDPYSRATFRNMEGMTPIHVAALFGCTRVVELLVKLDGPKMGAVKDAARNRPVHYAAQGGHTYLVGYFVNLGAPVDLRNSLGLTPFHIAVMHGRLDTAQYLAKNKASLTNKTEQALSKSMPIHAAAFGKSLQHIALSYFILDLEPSQYNVKDCFNESPIHWAATGGNLAVVEHLMELGAEFDEPSIEGRTPLHCASFTGQFKIVQHLVRAGANVMAQTNRADKEMMPIHLAACGHDPKQGQHSLVVTYLARKNQAMINANTAVGFRPIHFACIGGMVDIVAFLLEEGVSVETRTDTEGFTPLMLASLHGHVDLVKFLVRRCGADSDAREKKQPQAMPVHMAAVKGHLEIVRFLLKRGDKINAKTNEKATIAHYAANQGHLPIVMLLAEKGANLFAPDMHGGLPSHHAATMGHVPVLVYLHRLDPRLVHTRKHDGMNALDLYVERGFPVTDEVQRMMNQQPLKKKQREDAQQMYEDYSRRYNDMLQVTKLTNGYVAAKG